MDFTETGLRLINVLLGSIAVCAFYVIGHKNWHRYTIKMRNYFMALCGFCALVVEANMEILLGFDRGPRIILTTGVLIFTLTGLFRKGGYLIDDSE